MPVQQEMVMAGKFLTEALTRYETIVDEPTYPEYWGYNGLYHYATGDLPFGARKLMNARIDYTGRAVNYGGKATTLPLANFGINMDEYQSLVGVLAADWTWDELRSEEMSKENQFLPQVDVVNSYRMAMEKGLQEWMHVRTVFGDPTADFNGLITNPFVETVEVSAANNGITGTGATAATAYDFMRLQLSDFRKSSKLTTDATAVLTSEDVNSALTKRFADNSNDGNPYRLLTNSQSGQLRTIRAVNEMDGEICRNEGGRTSINSVAIAANADLLLMFDAAVQNNMVRHYAAIEALPPRQLDDQLTWRQVGLCATSETIYKQPFKARLLVLNRS